MCVCVCMCACVLQDIHVEYTTVIIEEALHNVAQSCYSNEDNMVGHSC